MIKKYRTINEIEEEYLRNHPDEIDDYINILFDEYAESGDTKSLLSSLHLVSRVKGIEVPALNKKDAVKALSENSTPELNNINTILQAMGYRLMAQKLPSATV
jgi:DNA-binding phage protein